MRNKTSVSDEELDDVKWMSPARVAKRFDISPGQVSRLATRFGWERIPVSTSPNARNAGVRYSVASIEEYEKKHSYKPIS